MIDGSAGFLIKKALAPIRPSEARACAEASFGKEARVGEGAKAMVEYRANGRVVREKPSD